MKRLIIVIIILSIFYGNLFSQTIQNMSESEGNVFEQKMIDHSKNIKTLQCTFVQEKISSIFNEKNASKGKLFYHSPNALRWEYTDPAIATFIINGNNAVLLGKNDEKLGNERMFKELGGIIISLINGNGITQSKQFTTAYYEMDNDQRKVILTPVQKRIKEFFNTIEMNIDVKTMLANEIILNEKSGDVTIISLSDKEINIEISSGIFKIK